MLIDLLFPPKCCFCNKISKDFLCKKCEKNLAYLQNNIIYKCKNEPFNYQLYAYRYQDEIRNKMISLKFFDKPEIANSFAKLLLNNKKICGFLKNYDIIIPVPMYCKKQILRGYNQSAQIAKIIGKTLNIEFCDNILVKTKNTKMQSSLNASERKINIKNAYECKNMKKIEEKKIILFDDIYTTGSTARECSKALNKADIIAVLTFAKD